jgi:hypothetical protein
VTDRAPAESSNGRPRPGGFIQGDQLYTLSEFRRRLGLGERALRTARRRGLPVHKVGRAKYVIGAEAIEWFKTK